MMVMGVWALLAAVAETPASLARLAVAKLAEAVVALVLLWPLREALAVFPRAHAALRDAQPLAQQVYEEAGCARKSQQWRMAMRDEGLL